MGAIAEEAYLFAYPLVLMEITRRVTTNVERSEGAHGPMNVFAHRESLAVLNKRTPLEYRRRVPTLAFTPKRPDSVPAA